MKTLYEILEVSENASDEIIEKAYKVLAKKCHPDLQTSENKLQAEDKMKEINEAYEILSSVEKRKIYDEELKKKREEIKNGSYDIYNGVNYNKSEYNKVKDMQRRRNEEKMRKEETKMRKQMEENLQQEYQNVYYNYLRSLGYRIKERWTWKKTKELFIVLIIIIAIFSILWIIPQTRQMMINFYENNYIIKILVDIVVGIFLATVDAIKIVITGK